MNLLGECEKCHGDLCVSGKAVCCSACGHQVPDHPAAQGPPPAPPPTHVIPAQEYASSVPDRVLALERDVRALRAALAQLKEGKPPRK